jgi:hypothetical protein
MNHLVPFLILGDQPLAPHPPRPLTPGRERGKKTKRGIHCRAAEAKRADYTGSTGETRCFSVFYVAMTERAEDILQPGDRCFSTDDPHLLDDRQGIDPFVDLREERLTCNFSFP